jgi:aspartate/methionine/tyrosine aminotransferase
MQVYPDRTITLNGFSKWGSSGGWRLGYAHFPETLSFFVRAMYGLGAGTYSCAPAPLQYAWANALKDAPAEIEAYVKDCRVILEKIARLTEKYLCLHLSPKLISSSS